MKDFRAVSSVVVSLYDMSNAVRCLQITGKAGVGKTTFVRALSRTAVARLAERKRMAPYHALRSKYGTNTHFRTACVSLLGVFAGSGARNAANEDDILYADWVKLYSAILTTLRSAGHAAEFRVELARQAHYCIHANGDRARQEESVARSLYQLTLTDQVRRGIDDSDTESIRNRLTTATKSGAFGQGSLTDFLLAFADTVLVDDGIDDELLSWALESSVFCEALLKSDPTLLLALADFAGAMGVRCGHMMSVRNERTYLGFGGYFEHVKGRSGAYTCVIPISDKKINLEALEFETLRHPMDLVLACMMFAVTHVGTLSSKYGAGYESRAMSGGLSSAILEVSQELSDLATHLGAYLIIEVRDDYIKSRDGDDLNTDDMGVPDGASRFMATTEVAIYITEIGRGVIRRRGYYEGAREYITSASWETKHLTEVLDGYTISVEDGKKDHGVEEINDFEPVGGILKIDSRILDIQS